LPPKAERVAGQGNPIAISTVLAKPADVAITPEDIQQRRVSRLFFLTPETAATVARLAYGAAQ
jgi:hypothetical protein